MGIILFNSLLNVFLFLSSLLPQRRALVPWRSMAKGFWRWVCNMHVQKRRHCKLRENAGKLSVRLERNKTLSHPVMAAILGILIFLKFVTSGQEFFFFNPYNFFCKVILPWYMKTIYQKTTGGAKTIFTASEKITNLNFSTYITC